MREADDNPLVVILHWRRPAATGRILGRLAELGVEPSRVLLVDNGSQDGSGEELRAAHPEVRFHANAENLGFAGGMNIGLRLALEEGFRSVALLNDDLEPEPGMLEAMARVLEEDPRAGVVGAVLFRTGPAGTLAHAANRVDLWTLRLEPGPEPAPDAPASAADWVSGAALLLRTAAVEEVGLLEEDFFAYWEEVDYCLRARTRGWRVLVAPGARAHHEDQGHDPLSATALYLQWRNRWLLARRHLSGLQRLVLLHVTLYQVARDVLGRTLSGRADSAWIPLLGTLHGLLGRKGAEGLEEIRAREARLRGRAA